MTPLMMAASIGFRDGVEMLMDYGAEVNYIAARKFITPSDLVSVIIRILFLTTLNTLRDLILK